VDVQCVADDDNHGFDGLCLLAYMATVGGCAGVCVISPTCLLWPSIAI
jgi:hypothetical protein